MAHEHVRVCPVCERENPPERTRCGCGALLAGVDFSLRRAPAPAADAPPAEAATDATPPPAAATGEAVETTAAAPATIACPHADCAQPNAPGATRCVYCNRPLALAPPAATVPGARPLPSALREAYRVVDAFPATGGEADILLVADAATGEKRVAKLYRRGIMPDFRLLDILSKSVGDTVVRVLAHGVSDGAAYELLEYVPGGTLEDLLREGPLPTSDIRRVVQEIAAALAGIHAHRILHRDLKPENVLVRARAPLSLALTDFGIASLAAATQHFTGAARTTRYAAPEALTGVLDAKSDWWSLGMIVLEAASGRHPFDGLTEQVMNHHLATRPIDVRGVYDDALRMLCRGLLLRDPKRRWGGDEVARWLAGDATLAVPDGADGAATVVRPYRFGKTEATNARELALALARHWDAARRDLARGQVGRWLESELHDYDLVRALRDIQDHRAWSEDARLLRFLLAAAPDLPPVWRGAPVSADALIAAARAATGGDDEARDWLDSLFRDEVLAAYGAVGHAALATLDRRWRAAWDAFVARWDAVQKAERAWRARPRETGGGAESRAVSFDDLAYAAEGKLVLPAQVAVHGPLLLALNDPAYVEGLQAQIVAALAEVAGACPWFESAWEALRTDATGTVAASMMLPHAREDAASERTRQAAAEKARRRAFADAYDAVRARLEEILALVPTGDEALERETVVRLLDAFEGFQSAFVALARQPGADPAHAGTRLALEKLSRLALATQRALADAEQVGGVNAIFMNPQRLLIGAAILGVALLIRVPAVILAVLAIAAVAVGWRWYLALHATDRSLEKLKTFGLHARTFLRAQSAGADGARSR